MLVGAILLLSIVLQLTAAFLAVRLIRVTEAGRAWGLIATAISLMAVRRCITLYGLISGDLSHPPDVSAEMIALGISALMATGIAALFLAIRRAKETVQDARDELERRVADRTAALTAANVALEENIAERKQAEDALRESEQKFRTLAEQSPNMIFINKAGRLVYVNARCEELMGYTREEYYGPDFDYQCLIAPEYLQVIQVAYGRHTRGEEVESIEYALIAKDGRRIEAIRTTKLMDYEGDKAILGIITDITERKRQQVAIAAAKDEWERTFDAVPDLIAILDTQHRIVRVNAAMADRVGLSPQECVGQSCYALIHGTEEPPSFCPHVQLLKDGQPHGCEFYEPNLGADFDVAVTPLCDAEGQLTRCVHVARDITERKRAEQAVRESEQRFRAIVDNARDGILLAEPESRRLTAGNEMICEMLGYTREEIQNLAVPDIHPKQDLPLALERFEKKCRGELTPDKDLPVKRKDGTVFYATINAFMITLAGKPYLAGIFRDVTDRRRSQEALRQSEARYRLIADNVTDMVWVGEIEGLAEMVDADTQAVVEESAGEPLDGWQFTFISPSIERVLGYEVHEGMRIKPKDLLTATSYSTLQQALFEELALERSGESDPSRQRTLELEHVTKDGNHRWCEVGMKFLRDDEDRVTGVVGSTRDISLRKDLEREISAAAMHEQRRIGQELHDGLGQQLLGLGLMARSLQKTLEGKGASEAESAGELVQVTKDAHDHVRAIIQGVRPVEVEAGGLMAALGNLADSTRQLTGVRCTFECREPVPVENDFAATQLFHVAQEAVRNAITHAHADHITVGLGRYDHRLQLWVRDDGLGLPVGSGRTGGMGLRIMRYRATLIGGALTVESGHDGGTLVTCIVPLEQLR